MIFTFIYVVLTLRLLMANLANRKGLINLKND